MDRDILLCRSIWWWWCGLLVAKQHANLVHKGGILLWHEDDIISYIRYYSGTSGYATLAKRISRADRYLDKPVAPQQMCGHRTPPFVRPHRAHQQHASRITRCTRSLRIDASSIGWYYPCKRGGLRTATNPQRLPQINLAGLWLFVSSTVRLICVSWTSWLIHASPHDPQRSMLLLLDRAE